MSKRNELNSYIARLQHRLRLGAWLRGAAIFTGSALFVTVGLVLLLNHYAFPAHGVTGARLALLVALAAVAGFGIALPLMRLTRARVVREAEAAHSGLEQRLTTFHEREREGGDPFLELLAADTLSRTQDAAPSSLVPDNRLFALGGAGLACFSVLAWMIAAGPGYLGYGASLLWTGPKKDVAPLYAIAVAPGDVAVRRNSDQLITARVSGMRPEKVQIFAHYQSAGAWEPVTMQAQPDSGGLASFQFLFAGLPENVEYYVAAGPLVSPHYKVRVVDLPAVKGIRVTYQYPKWTGMKAVTEEHSGDLRAIEGTDAALEVEMDRPLKDGQLALDGGKAIQLARGEGNKYRGTIHLDKDGAYHVAATDQGQPVRLSEDYFIATDKAMPPEVAISRPGGDYRASPIEEVTVGVKAADQFGLHDVHLHYSVNGGPDRDVSMLKTPGTKEADGSYTLRLEDFKLVPGDLVSVYATAKDGHAEARTQISFIQADPFEREFSQSQQSGGGGGGGGGGGQNNQTDISKREKELIAATWKQQNDKAATPKDSAVAGQFLSDAQQKLRDQVMALSARMQSRDLSAANEEFTGFEKDMQTAAEAMAPSADKLKGMQWKDAMPLEQKALQALLRAEATFRKIQIAFGQQGGGGGGGGNSAGRDLASLFDLELDTEKNQYETAQTASPAEQHAKSVEDALAKLDALAKRQEELANQQRNPQQNFQERWQQEMLRREAEQLQRQMEQLAQNSQGQQGGQQQSGQQQSGQQQNGQQSSSGQSSGQSGSQSGSQQQSASSQGGSQSQSGSQSKQQQGGRQSSGQSSDQRIEQALSRLRQAGEAMKRSGGPQQSAEAARQAAERLRDAENLLGGTQQQLASGKVQSLSHEADRLTQEERAQADRIGKLTAGQQGDTSAMDRDSMMARLRERDRLASERQQLSNDLSKLQNGVREAARGMASNQPGVAQKLRDALTEMDQSDLDNHVQRTADWLRGGINPNTNGTENQIAEGLQKLSQQLRQAQQGAGQGKPGQRGAGQGDETAALGQVERLRSQLEAMASSRRGNGRQAGQNAQNGRQGRDGQQGGNSQRGQNGNEQGQAGGNGQQSGNGGQQSPGGQQSGQSGGGGTQAGGSFGQQAGDRTGQRGGQSGDVRNGGGGADGTVWGNINTGNNRYGDARPRPAPPDASSNPADTERTYQQGIRELNQLRQMIQGDAQAAKEVQELARQMQQLDPSRFPGNPAMVEQMHREVLSSIDRIELQLQRNGSTEARTGKPYAVPAGYQDSVAEYYRRLSKNP
ncbi:MAG: hypothetical protein JWQ49_4543 [Edaphobacter sp.]|nr:hypothetical protein [Edaphobacter sp.]